MGKLFRIHRKKHQITAKSLDDLISGLKLALHDYINPTTTEENVILYNVESHVSFAENEAGDIFPNATFDGARWVSHNDKRYGEHHSSDPSKGWV